MSLSAESASATWPASALQSRTNVSPVGNSRLGDNHQHVIIQQRSYGTGIDLSRFAEWLLILPVHHADWLRANEVASAGD